MMGAFASNVMIDTQSLTDLIVKTLEDNKAQSIVEMDISEHSDLAERMIVCTGTSGRHAKTLAEKTWVASKEIGIIPIGQEGEDSSGWILLDLGSVIVHVMLAETRDYYNLEDLWSLTPSRNSRAN
jgi:ribosome-associated protein